MKFDRILADVPCSGDGTFRKAPTLLESWKPADANNFHSVQKEILSRSIQLCKTGGRIVYSTCSMNPVENEAVLLYCLRKFKGSVELVDVSATDVCKNLKYAQGLSHWSVMDNKGEIFNEYPEGKTKLIKSQFTRYVENKDQPEDYNLHRAIRIYPHLQNTGGFFISVLKKTRDLAETSQSVVSNDRKV